MFCKWQPAVPLDGDAGQGGQLTRGQWLQEGLCLQLDRQVDPLVLAKVKSLILCLKSHEAVFLSIKYMFLCLSRTVKEMSSLLYRKWELQSYWGWSNVHLFAFAKCKEG